MNAKPGWLKIAGLLVVLVFSLTSCVVTLPRAGPTQPALIGTGKTQPQYDTDDGYCRALASERTGVDPNEVMQESQVESAVLGGVFMGLLGAVIGSAFGGGRGAGIGAVAGVASGAASGLGAGTSAGIASASAAQERYNAEYIACMYVRGHQVPGVASVVQPQPSAAPAYSLPPPPPPPPAGYQQPSSSPMPPAAVGAVPPPPGAGTPGAASVAPCKTTGKYVRTTQGLVAECE